MGVIAEVAGRCPNPKRTATNMIAVQKAPEAGILSGVFHHLPRNHATNDNRNSRALELITACIAAPGRADQRSLLVERIAGTVETTAATARQALTLPIVIRFDDINSYSKRFLAMPSLTDA